MKYLYRIIGVKSWERVQGFIRAFDPDSVFSTISSTSFDVWTRLNELQLKALKGTLSYELKRLIPDPEELVYLASPYTHPDRGVQVRRFEAVCKVAAQLIRGGTLVYCPVAHSHPLTLVDSALAGDWATWAQLNCNMLRACARMLVLRLDGWESSVGVAAEMYYMKSLGREIGFIDPEI